MKLIEILSENTNNGQYDHYTIVSNKDPKDLVDANNYPVDDLYNFIITSFPWLKDRQRECTKCLVRDLSEYIEY